MIKRFLGILLAGVMVCGLTACGSTTTDLTGDVPEEDTVEEVEIVEEEPVVDEPVEETVVEEEVTVDDKVYIKEDAENWPDKTGLVYRFFTENGTTIDVITFKADFDIANDNVDIKETFEGVYFNVPTSAMSDEKLKIANLGDKVGITNQNLDFIVWYAYNENDLSDFNTTEHMDTGVEYKEVRNGHFIVAYTSDYPDEVAQQTLDSCEYYSYGGDTLAKYISMHDKVIAE